MSLGTLCCFLVKFAQKAIQVQRHTFSTLGLVMAEGERTPLRYFTAKMRDFLPHQND